MACPKVFSLKFLAGSSTARSMNSILETVIRQRNADNGRGDLGDDCMTSMTRGTAVGVRSDASPIVTKRNEDLGVI